MAGNAERGTRTSLATAIFRSGQNVVPTATNALISIPSNPGLPEPPTVKIEDATTITIYNTGGPVSASGTAVTYLYTSGTGTLTGQALSASGLDGYLEAAGSGGLYQLRGGTAKIQGTTQRVFQTNAQVYMTGTRHFCQALSAAGTSSSGISVCQNSLLTWIATCFMTGNDMIGLANSGTLTVFGNSARVTAKSGGSVYVSWHSPKSASSLQASGTDNFVEINFFGTANVESGGSASIRSSGQGTIQSGARAQVRAAGTATVCACRVNTP